jgi:hypothetical protein
VTWLFGLWGAASVASVPQEALPPWADAERGIGLNGSVRPDRLVACHTGEGRTINGGFVLEWLKDSRGPSVGRGHTEHTEHTGHGPIATIASLRLLARCGGDQAAHLQSDH